VAVAHLRPRFVLARLAVILPFVAFAFALPFVAGGERVSVAGLELSRSGLWGLWNVLTKASIGATTSILLAATTEIPRLLDGMARLHVPRVLTLIAAFMIRYLELTANELGRMRTAMAARGYDPRWLWQMRPIAASAGALFVRSYERGERVHAAMLARGYTGTMPIIHARPASLREWAAVAVLVVVVWTVAVVALVAIP
jgi:cobalt/nickel transport system permease protein